MNNKIKLTLRTEKVKCRTHCSKVLLIKYCKDLPRLPYYIVNRVVPCYKEIQAYIKYINGLVLVWFVQFY